MRGNPRVSRRQLHLYRLGVVLLFMLLTSSCQEKSLLPHVCGNDFCEEGENAITCPEDCLDGYEQEPFELNQIEVGLVEGICGNNLCEVGEYPWTCPQDCTCGDGVCRGETCSTCPEDCNFGNPDAPCCGDGKCTREVGESFLDCPEECGYGGACGNGYCEASLGENLNSCYIDCLVCYVEGTECGNGVCDINETSLRCFQDCNYCGNGYCDLTSGENCVTCAEDCGACDSLCGNGSCDFMQGETCSLCPEDCYFISVSLPCCGNQLCESGETEENCVDCGGPVPEEDIVETDCGNYVIEPGEECEQDYHCAWREGAAGEYLSCSSHCACVSSPFCNYDGVCNNNEQYWNCPQDCTCGDGVCRGENCCTCPEDCGSGDAENPCSENPYIASCGDLTHICGDGICEYWQGEFCGTCALDCGSCDDCGDYRCFLENGESCQTCPADCHFGNPDMPCCGNGLCELSETPENCLCDCGGEPDDCEDTPIEEWPGNNPLAKWRIECGNGPRLNSGEQCERDYHCSIQFGGEPGDWACIDCACGLRCDGDGICDEPFEDMVSCPIDCLVGSQVVHEDLLEALLDAWGTAASEGEACIGDEGEPGTWVCTCVPLQECGDGYCSRELEDSETCPEDCTCRDDGICRAKEGFDCADCEYLLSVTGVTVAVSVDTNCRLGPGSAYPNVSALQVGEAATAVGRNAASTYWVILNPANPSTTCWLWGAYATVEGDAGSLPVISPPPVHAPTEEEPGSLICRADMGPGECAEAGGTYTYPPSGDPYCQCP